MTGPVTTVPPLSELPERLGKLVEALDREVVKARALPPGMPRDVVKAIDELRVYAPPRGVQAQALCDALGADEMPGGNTRRRRRRQRDGGA